jgi:hypothetical protein
LIVRERREGVVVDAVTESGDSVYEPGISKHVQRVSCGLAGDAVVCTQTGD